MCSRAAVQAGSTNCKIALCVECDTLSSLPSRILEALWNYEQIYKDPFFREIRINAGAPPLYLNAPTQESFMFTICMAGTFQLSTHS